MIDDAGVGRSARALLMQRFQWVDGHADVWAIFRDPDALRSLVPALVAPFRDAGVSTVAGIESRGFLLGGACAFELGVGFTAIRKSGALFPGAKIRGRTTRDYRGNTGELLMQRAAAGHGDRVLLVDDWIETGSQARTAQQMLSECNATLIGVSVLVDQLADSARRGLPPVAALIRFDELPSHDQLGGPSVNRVRRADRRVAPQGVQGSVTDATRSDQSPPRAIS